MQGPESRASRRRVGEEVRRYYDVNTARFSGHDSAVESAVHRAVWAPGVTTPREAFAYVNELILARAREVGAGHVLDLGCGVGGTLVHVCAPSECRGVGVTLSPVQARRAAEGARARGMAPRVRFLVGNYLDLPELPPSDLAWAVESFVHGPDAAGFFASATSALGPGGLLVVCDDFLTPLGAAHDPGTEPPRTSSGRLLADFRWGWHVHSLVTVAAARDLAARAGLEPVEDLDLTPYLALATPWDRFISLCVRLFRWLPLDTPWWRSWVGGHGIQESLLRGLAEYRFLVFRRAGA